mmetsp:Transcript_21739/g.25111  ORF Transcript_21739/g.25111 Transcript_21739/m.25111 type:complete len:269 (+) Transcript_21739:88-894(+)
MPFAIRKAMNRKSNNHAPTTTTSTSPATTNKGKTTNTTIVGKIALVMSVLFCIAGMIRITTSMEISGGAGGDENQQSKIRRRTFPYRAHLRQAGEKTMDTPPSNINIRRKLKKKKKNDEDDADADNKTKKIKNKKQKVDDVVNYPIDHKFFEAFYQTYGWNYTGDIVAEWDDSFKKRFQKIYNKTKAYATDERFDQTTMKRVKIENTKDADADDDNKKKKDDDDDDDDDNNSNNNKKKNNNDDDDVTVKKGVNDGGRKQKKGVGKAEG